MTDMERNAASPLHTSIEVATPSTSEPSYINPGNVRIQSSSSIDSLKKVPHIRNVVVQDVAPSKEDDDEDDSGAITQYRRPGRTATVMLALSALVILSWWVISVVLPISRDRWLIQTLWAWFFVFIILFRFVPASIVSRPVSATWNTIIANPVANIPPRAMLVLTWLGALAITCGCAFGFERAKGTIVADRVISLIGVFVFQFIICAHSMNRSAINWIRIPISIILQQALAIFVLKTSAGFAIFSWFSGAVFSFQSSTASVIAFMFDKDTATKNWFFASELAGTVLLSAWVHILFSFNWMPWLTMHFAWFGQKVFGASGAETFVAIWSPWFGQVYSALLVAPYVEGMTDAELYSVMAISMSSISSLKIDTYATKLAIPLRSLIAQSAIVIPGSIINAKVAFPEDHPDKPITRSRESTKTAKNLNLKQARNPFERLSDGACLGLKVGGSVIIHILTILSLLFFGNGVVDWIFVGFGVRELDFNFVIAGMFYPMVFLIGVPRHEIFGLAYILSTKITVNSDFAYKKLMDIMMGPSPLSPRGLGVITFALANAAGVVAIATQVGAMSVLAPSRTSVITKGIIPALIIAIMSTLQATAIAANLL